MIMCSYDSESMSVTSLQSHYYVEVLADLKKVSKLLMVKKETVKKYIRAALSDRQELDIW